MVAYFHSDIQDTSRWHSENNPHDIDQKVASNCDCLHRQPYTSGYCDTGVPLFQRESQDVLVGNADSFWHCSHDILVLQKNQCPAAESWGNSTNLGLLLARGNHSLPFCWMHHSYEEHEQISQYCRFLVSELELSHNLLDCFASGSRKSEGFQAFFVEILVPPCRHC